MVGGLADWFAVTALFRRPLGLPIPHTAIIPENKDRIADTMANFLRTNFLTPVVVARRMRAMNLAKATGDFLSRPAKGEGSRIRSGAGRNPRRSARIARSRTARRASPRRSAAPDRKARGLAAARADAGRGDRRQAPPAADRRADPLGRADARRQREHGPPDHPRQGQLGGALDRPRRAAGQFGARRALPAARRGAGRTPTIPCEARSRRGSKSWRTTCRPIPPCGRKSRR